MNEEKLQKIISIIRNLLYEESPTMNLGAGKIAGTVEAGDDPPVKKRKKYIFGIGYRKLWKP
jgi:hypothetical protein